MNKIKEIFKIIFIFLIITLICPKFVYAASSSSIEGVNLTSPGSFIFLDIKISSDETIDGVKADFTYERTVLEFISIENKESWKLTNKIDNKEGPITLEFNRENGLTGGTTVATLKFKVKEDAAKTEALLKLNSTTVTQEDDTINTIPESSKNIAIKSTDNYLSDLKLNGKTLTNFSPKTYSYSIQVEANTTTASIDAILNNSTASFVEKFGSRSVPLDYGENVIEVKVMSASLVEKTYIININRLDNRGTNNNLTKIILNSDKVKINFDKMVTEYNIMTHKLTKLDVEATAEDIKAKVKIDKPESLVIGENIVKITVTSEDGKDKTYTIKINNVDYDIDTSIKKIEISGYDGNLEFDPNVLDYEIIYKEKYKNELVILKPKLSSQDEDVRFDEALFEKTSANIESGTVVQMRVYALDRSAESIYTITFIKDNRINFFFILGAVILVVLIIIFIYMFVNLMKEKNNKKKKEADLEKTKRLKKVNLE